MLDAWCASHEQLNVVHVLSHEDEGSSWTGARGYITRELISEHCPPPSETSALVFVCGPPPMYEALCGPRGEEGLSGALADLGYRNEQVIKF